MTTQRFDSARDFDMQGWDEPDDEISEEDYEEVCYECGGEGFVLADCFEDTCCCADPESSHGFIKCPVCG